MKFSRILGFIASAAIVTAIGCDKAKEQTDKAVSAVTGKSDTKKPVFTLAWNEYPSSALFPAAQALGLISGEEGKTGPLEDKWGVDLVLKEVDYNTLLTLYGAGKADSVTIVNLDTLNLALTRPGTAVMSVSTSKGGDAIVANANVKSIDDLKNVTTFGMEKSVSEFMFDRVLETAGKNTADYKFSNMDVDQATQALQAGQKNIESVAIFNPFIFQVTHANKATHVIAGSEKIPNEIVDVIWTGNDSLKREGGDNYGALLADIYYTVNKMLADPATHAKVLDAMTAKAGVQASADDMDNDILQKTVLYTSPDDVTKLYAGDFKTVTMPRVVDWGLNHKLYDTKPTVGFDDENAQVNFSTKYIKLSQSK